MCSKKTLAEIAKKTGDSEEAVLLAEADAQTHLKSEGAPAEDAWDLAEITHRPLRACQRFCDRTVRHMAEVDPPDTRPEIELHVRGDAATTRTSERQRRFPD